MATHFLHHIGQLVRYAWGGFVLLIVGILGWGYLRGEVFGLGDVATLFGSPLLVSLIGGLAFLLVTLSMFALYVRPHNQRFPNHSRRSKTDLPPYVMSRIQTKLREVESLMAANRPSSYRSAVIMMDNLLDLALQELGYAGSLGDKLQASGERFSNLNAVWAGHKYRNRLVHDLDQEPLRLDALEAIVQLKQALHDLGVK